MNPSLDTSSFADTRPDYLVSVVLADAADATRYREVLQPLSERLEQAFQFWEVVIAIPEAGVDETSNLSAALRGIPNIRILRLSAAGNFYRRRLAGVTEAIGDIVILSTLDEISRVNVSQLASDIYRSNEAVALVGPRQGWGVTTLLMRALGSFGGYRIDQRDTLTIGFPRSVVENVLPRSDAEILLRFEPLSGMLTFRRMPLPDANLSSCRHWRDWRRRVALVGDMMISASPRILRAVAFVAFLAASIAIAYGIYAVLIWLFRDNVAAGWLTTSLLQALTIFLLGTSISAISMGLVRVIDALSNEGRYSIVDEINTVDLIGNIKATNVDFVVDEIAATEKTERT